MVNQLDWDRKSCKVQQHSKRLVLILADKISGSAMGSAPRGAPSTREGWRRKLLPYRAGMNAHVDPFCPKNISPPNFPLLIVSRKRLKRVRLNCRSFWSVYR